MLNETNEEYVTIPEAYRRSGIGVTLLRQAVAAGELEAFEVGRWQRLRWRDVVRWIERTPTKPDEARAHARGVVGARLARGRP